LGPESTSIVNQISLPNGGKVYHLLGLFLRKWATFSTFWLDAMPKTTLIAFRRTSISTPGYKVMVSKEEQSREKLLKNPENVYDETFENSMPRFDWRVSR
jgi:hypothetical protein